MIILDRQLQILCKSTKMSNCVHIVQADQYMNRWDTEQHRNINSILFQFFLDNHM